MVLTRANKVEIYNHIVDNILNDQTISAALKHDGYKELEDLLSMTDNNVWEMRSVTQASDTSAKVIEPIHRSKRNKVRLLLGYIKTKQAAGLLESGDDWLELSKDEFDSARINPSSTTLSNIASSNGPSLGSKSGTPMVMDPVAQSLDNFKRGVKRDAALYPTLRDDSHWDNWNRSLHAQARAHDVTEVLDKSYVPNNSIAKELFDQKQSFMYSVLNRVVLTDMGKTIVRRHEHDYDAQAVYAELVEHAKTSTAANITRTKLIDALTTSRLDSRWTGTTVGFILHWQDKMRMLEELIPVAEHYTENSKKRMLQTAVQGIGELRQVMIQEEQLVATGNSHLTYNEYVNLLISAATRRDDVLKLPASRSRRTINQARSSYGFDEADNFSYGYVDAGDNFFNYSSTYDDHNELELLVNRHYIPPDVWHQLPQEAREKLLKEKIDSNNPSNTSFRPNSQSSSKFTPRQAKEHVLESSKDTDNTIDISGLNLEVINEDNNNNIQGNMHEVEATHPGDIRNVLTSASKSAKPKRSDGNKTGKRMIVLNGERFYSANTIVIKYQSFNQRVLPKLGSLVDRGANGGIAGDDVVIIDKSHRTCDVSGIDNYTMQSLPIVTCAGLVQTENEPIIVILHQYAYMGRGPTIHSSAQIEHFGNVVDDRSARVKGKQCIVTLDNILIPLNIRNGLAYISMSKPTKYDMDKYVHAVLTSDVDWNPCCIDNEYNAIGPSIVPQDTFFDCVDNPGYKSSLVDVNDITTPNLDFDDYLYDLVQANTLKLDIKEPNFEALRPNFGFAPARVIKDTFKCTTQWAKMIERYPFRKHFKSRFPALNVSRRNEPVATDTVFSDTPAIDNGCKIAQVFVGCKTFVTDVYPLKLERQFVHTLQDNIRERGAMDKLVSDRAKVEISEKVKDVLRNYRIQEWQSEPYHEHQNPSERRYQTLKTCVNNILDRTGAPPSTWLLCYQYICVVLNLTYVDKLGTTPLQCLTGQTQDISILLPFSFWEPVYYATADKLSYNTNVSFPSESSEAKGNFVGFGDSVGDALTFKVLTNDTQRVLFRSSVRSAIKSHPNLRLDPTNGENSSLAPSSSFLPEYMDAEQEDNLVDVQLSEDVDNNLDNDETIDSSLYETTSLPASTFNYGDETEVGIRQGNLKGYNDALDYLEQKLDKNPDPEDKLWHFTHIISHEGPLNSDSPTYKGSKYNLLVVWEDGTQTYEPLSSMAQDDPVTVAQYAKDNDLLTVTGWKRLGHLQRSLHKLEHYVNKRVVNYGAPKYKFGTEVPRSLKHAFELDYKNCNLNWTTAINLEVSQVLDYQTFTNLGKNAEPPKDHKKIRLHFVFDVKHDGRHKARLVAGGHLTDEPDNSVYSSVVSLRDLRLTVFAGELNGLTVWGADVGNAYLESYTKERVYIVAGPEFGELEGSVLVIKKALYGLRSSGLRWHERFADTLRELGFTPSQASIDVWMRPTKDYYEYIAVYVDDLAIVAKNPKLITDTLVDKFKYKLKDVGPINYHLGGNFGRDDDGTLHYGPRKYIDKLITSYTTMFGKPPVECVSPLVRGDHPEMDDSPELDEDGIKRYQSMIGALQWVVSLGRFDVMAAVMTMSRFRIAPRIGHLDRLKRVYGYLKKFSNGAIRFRTGQPEFNGLVKQVYDWSNTVYEDCKDRMPTNLPKMLGNSVVTTTYVDANLLHCQVTGRSSTGILHIVNGTPIDWYSKRQSTVESATYGSEFVAARVATDQVIDLQLTLAYLGIKVIRSVMFGDNQSVVTSSTVPQSKLNKRHVAISYHRVREAIALGVLEFYHIDGSINPADMLSKYAGYQQFWPMLRSLLFWGVNLGKTPGEEDKKSLVVTCTTVGSVTTYDNYYSM